MRHKTRHALKCFNRFCKKARIYKNIYLPPPPFALSLSSHSFSLSFSLHFSLYVFISVWFCIYLSIYLSIYLFVCLSLSLSLSLSLFFSVSHCLSRYLPVSICLSFWTSVSIFLERPISLPPPLSLRIYLFMTSSWYHFVFVYLSDSFSSFLYPSVSICIFLCFLSRYISVCLSFYLSVSLYLFFSLSPPLSVFVFHFLPFTHSHRILN